MLIQIFNLEVSDVPRSRRRKIGHNLAKVLWDHIFSSLKDKFYIILMINSVSDKDIIHDFKLNISNSHRNNLGWAFKNGSPKENQELLRKATNSTRIWQAGMSHRLDPRVPHQIIEEAVGERNERGIKKVIAGVVTLARTVRELLK